MIGKIDFFSFDVPTCCETFFPGLIIIHFGTCNRTKCFSNNVIHFFFFIFSIKCDLVVVSCDTITNVDLFTMLDHFRKNSASIVTQLFKGGLEADTIVPGPKTKHKQGKLEMH